METVNNLNDIINSIPKEWSVKEKARKAYLLLGANSYYNPRFNYLFGYPQVEIFEESSAYQMPNVGVCRKFSNQYLWLLQVLGIKAREIRDEIDDFGMYHSDVGFLDENLEEHIANMALDLPRIQTHSSTTHFGKDSISEEELRAIDLKIGYITKQKGYTDDYFDAIRETLDGHNLTEDQKVELMFSTIPRFFDLEKMGPDEQAKALKFFARNVFGCKNTTLCRAYVRTEGEEYYYLQSVDKPSEGTSSKTTYRLYNRILVNSWGKNIGKIFLSQYFFEFFTLI